MMDKASDNPIHGSQNSARNPSLFLFSTLLAMGIDQAHQTLMIKTPTATASAFSQALAFRSPARYHR